MDRDHGMDSRWPQDNGNVLLSVGKSPFEGFGVARKFQSQAEFGLPSQEVLACIYLEVCVMSE